MTPQRKRSEDATSEANPPEVATPATVAPRKKRKATLAYDPSNHPVTRSIARQMKVAARDAVFATHELVENILSFLPPKKILNVMRVSKSQFKAVIDKSPDIQEKLFLRPPRPAGDTASSSSLTHQCIIPSSLTDTYRAMRPAQLVVLNPRLQDYLQFRYAREGYEHFHEESISLPLEMFAPRTLDTGELPAQSHSFLDNYLTDPPCQAIHVEISVEFDVHAPTNLFPERMFTYNVLRDNLESSNVVQAGPTIRDLVTAASQMPQPAAYTDCNITRESYPRGIASSGTTAVSWNSAPRLPCHVPPTASMDEVLSLLSAANASLAAGIAKRRTQVTIRLMNTYVYRPEGLMVLPMALWRKSLKRRRP